MQRVCLTPLIGILFRFFLALSGRSVIADQDIFFFFLGPVGWASLVIVGAAWIAIVALAVLFGVTPERNLTLDDG